MHFIFTGTNTMFIVYALKRNLEIKKINDVSSSNFTLNIMTHDAASGGKSVRSINEVVLRKININKMYFTLQ